jgi:Magnesium chelatase, subunit ChlI
MLARRLTTILPAMTLAEALDTTRIHSVAGLTGARTAVVITRPCRAPHHTISDVGLIGGGHMPREVSPADNHNGTIWHLAAPAAAPSGLLASSVSGQVFCNTDAGDSWRKFTREFGAVHALAWVPN